MKNIKIMTIVGLLVSVTSAIAASVPSPLKVNAKVVSGCLLEADDIVYGVIPIKSTGITAMSELRIHCSKKTNYNIRAESPTSPNSIGYSGSKTYYGNGGVKLTSSDASNSDVLWAWIYVEDIAGSNSFSNFGYPGETNWGNGYAQFKAATGRSEGELRTHKLKGTITTGTSFSNSVYKYAKADNYSKNYVMTATF